MQARKELKARLTKYREEFLKKSRQDEDDTDSEATGMSHGMSWSLVMGSVSSELGHMTFSDPSTALLDEDVERGNCIKSGCKCMVVSS